MKNKTLFVLLGMSATAFVLIFFWPQAPEHGANEAKNQPPRARATATATRTPEQLEKKPLPPPSPTQPGSQPSFEVSTPSQTIHASDILVPHGARVPAVLMDGGSPDDSPETQNIMNGLIEEFAGKIQEARRANRNMEEAWEEAREAADERYRQFFGFEAFNEATLEAAGEAAEEAAVKTEPAVR